MVPPKEPPGTYNVFIKDASGNLIVQAIFTVTGPRHSPTSTTGSNSTTTVASGGNSSPGKNNIGIIGFLPIAPLAIVPLLLTLLRALNLGVRERSRKSEF